MVRRATCRCGEVEFELRGEPTHFGGGPRCHCNDCVTAAVYVNNKAAAAGCENISVLEKGNPQAAHYLFYRIPDIKLVRGGDKIMKYRLRPQSTSVRTYTSCCYTTVICMLGPKSLAIKSEKNVLINFNTVTPMVVCPKSHCSRIQCKEALRPADLPNDGIVNNQAIPLWFLWDAIGEVVFGSKRNNDTETRELIFINHKTVTEVAGGPAYEAAGYKDVSQLFVKSSFFP
mmetsp:Transcript_22745/g.31179  ORF Transcript_22745/g.31179 Transcript_22745/m.31179 type:complete len:230 (+) Transcript_22745:470-1159(+)